MYLFYNCTLYYHAFWSFSNTYTALFLLGCNMIFSVYGPNILLHNCPTLDASQTLFCSFWCASITASCYLMENRESAKLHKCLLTIAHSEQCKSEHKAGSVHPGVGRRDLYRRRVTEGNIYTHTLYNWVIAKSLYQPLVLWPWIKWYSS